MSPEEIRDAAETLIVDHAQDVEFLSVCEHLENVEQDDPNGDLARAIDGEIRKATVTVTWGGRRSVGVNRRRVLGVAAGLAALPLLAACPGGTGGEVEDCDADDLREGDDDCDTDGTERKKTKPKTKSKPKSGSRPRPSGGRR